MTCVKQSVWFFTESEGKGTLGCLFSLLLLGAALFVGVKIIPIYYAFSDLETDIKTEVSKAGAHFYDDETIVKDILDLAKKNEIELSPDDIKIERLAGQVYVNIHSDVPVDFMLFEHSLTFNIKASSYVGRL